LDEWSFVLMTNQVINMKGLGLRNVLHSLENSSPGTSYEYSPNAGGIMQICYHDKHWVRFWYTTFPGEHDVFYFHTKDLLNHHDAL
jgi:hypothetical protein